MAELVEKLAMDVHHLPPKFVLPLHRRPTSVSLPSTANIPTVDLSGLENDLSRPQTLAQIHHACSHWGFFQAIHHGVPDRVLQQLKLQVEEFFALPFDERMPGVVGNLGEGYGSGFVRPETGITDWRDFWRLLTYPDSKRDYSVWPKSPQFRKAIDDYSKETRMLLQRMLACLSQNLGLRPSYLEDALGEIDERILINHYPPCPEPNFAAGLDEHTDKGAITCLWQYEDVVGLHVCKDGDWIPVESLPGALTIIVGDQVKIASNGIYKSLLHRAVLNAKKRRISIVTFFHLQPDTIVGPAPELIDSEKPALYHPARFGDLVYMKLKG